MPPIAIIIALALRRKEKKNKEYRLKLNKLTNYIVSGFMWKCCINCWALTLRSKNKPQIIKNSLNDS